MSDTFNVDKIAQLLEESQGVTAKNAKILLDEAFKIMGDLLIAEATVRITGFGTFKPEMPSNKNGGIQKKLGEKRKRIVFTPSKGLKSSMQVVPQGTQTCPIPPP